MTPLEIINRWCKLADEKGMPDHRICFWRIRDILEGNSVSRSGIIEAFLFLIRKCKPSNEREILIKEIRDTLVFEKNGIKEEEIAEI